MPKYYNILMIFNVKSTSVNIRKSHQLIILNGLAVMLLCIILLVLISIRNSIVETKVLIKKMQKSALSGISATLLNYLLCVFRLTYSFLLDKGKRILNIISEAAILQPVFKYLLRKINEKMVN
jgi:hypothetical protein